MCVSYIRHRFCQDIPMIPVDFHLSLSFCFLNQTCAPYGNFFLLYIFFVTFFIASWTIKQIPRQSTASNPNNWRQTYPFSPVIVDVLDLTEGKGKVRVDVTRPKWPILWLKVLWLSKSIAFFWQCSLFTPTKSLMLPSVCSDILSQYI